MKVDDLRNIGKMLLAMIPHYRFAEGSRNALRKGAAGDATFPMDHRAEEIIISSLESLGESFHIVSEEYGIKNVGEDGPYVIIDPIDGSKNAVNGLPVFSTSIAASESDRIGDVFLGYVLNLVSGDEFWAEKGQGAYLNGRKITTQETDETTLVLYEAQSPSRDIPKIMPLLTLFRRTRCLGSIALDLAHLAMGSASVFVSPFDSRCFDYAGGWLLVKEAGGIVTDLSGNVLDDEKIHVGSSLPILASANQELHRKAIEVMKG